MGVRFLPGAHRPMLDLLANTFQNITLFDFVGIVGAAFVIGTYFALTRNLVTSTQRKYGIKYKNQYLKYPL